MKKLSILSIVLFLLVSCSITREDTQSDSISDYNLTGNVAGMNIKLKLKGNTSTKETKDTSVPLVEDSFFLEAILGTLGLGGVGILFRRLNQYKGTLKGIVGAIESEDEKTVKPLKEKLSKRLDQPHKAIIKKLKS